MIRLFNLIYGIILTLDYNAANLILLMLSNMLSAVLLCLFGIPQMALEIYIRLSDVIWEGGGSIPNTGTVCLHLS